MNEQPVSVPSPNWPQMVGVARRHGWIVLVAAVVGALLGLVWSHVQTPQYRTSAVVSLEPIGGTDVGSAPATKGAVAAKIDVLASAATAERVAAKIGDPVRAGFAHHTEDTTHIRITGYSDTPERAALIANTYADVFNEVRRELDLARNAESTAVVLELLGEVDAKLAAAAGRDGVAGFDGPAPVVGGDELVELEVLQLTYRQQLVALGDQAQFMAVGRVAVVDPASPPDAAYSPIVTRNVAVAALMGGLVGVGLISARRRFDDRMDGSVEVAEVTGVPVVGVIPRDDEWTRPLETHLRAIEQPGSVVAEAFRTLRTSLAFVRLDDPISVLQVTSAQPGEGKSTIVANLGITMARAGHRVLLVDLDLRRPRLHHFFGVDNARGVTSVLLDPGSLSEVVVTDGPVPNLSVLPSGPLPPGPSELLDSERTRALVADLAGGFDLVILDSPPVLGISDPLIVSSMADATVLVVRNAVTNRSEARQAVDLLERVDAPLVGAIANDVAPSRRGYGYGYDYGSSYTDPERYGGEVVGQTR